MAIENACGKEPESQQNIPRVQRALTKIILNGNCQDWNKGAIFAPFLLVLLLLLCTNKLFFDYHTWNCIFYFSCKAHTHFLMLVGTCLTASFWTFFENLKTMNYFVSDGHCWYWTIQILLLYKSNYSQGVVKVNNILKYIIQLKPLNIITG